MRHLADLCVAIGFLLTSFLLLPSGEKYSAIPSLRSCPLVKKLTGITLEEECSTKVSDLLLLTLCLSEAGSGKPVFFHPVFLEEWKDTKHRGKRVDDYPRA